MLFCTIGLGSAMTKVILSSRSQATGRASLELRQATKEFPLVRLR